MDRICSLYHPPARSAIDRCGSAAHFIRTGPLSALRRVPACCVSSGIGSGRAAKKEPPFSMMQHEWSMFPFLSGQAGGRHTFADLSSTNFVAKRHKIRTVHFFRTALKYRLLMHSASAGKKCAAIRAALRYLPRRTPDGRKRIWRHHQ